MEGVKVKMRIHTDDFRKALKTYQKATEKDMAEVLNRAGRNVAFKAMAFTPMARKSKVDQFHPTRRKGPKARMFYAQLTQSGRSRKGRGIKRAALDKYETRNRSRGYLKAGWIEAAKDFGGRPRKKTFPGGRAAQGYGKKASTFRLEAWLYNFAEGADKVGKVPLNRAMAVVAKDMTNYAYKRMRRTGKRYSGR